MKEGDILLTTLRQADGKEKVRPVLCLALMPPYQDLLVCGVSSQLRQAVAGFDEILKQQDPDFAASGLKSDSVARLGYLAVLCERDFLGRLGSVSRERTARLRLNLARFLSR